MLIAGRPFDTLEAIKCKSSPGYLADGERNHYAYT